MSRRSFLKASVSLLLPACAPSLPAASPPPSATAGSPPDGLGPRPAPRGVRAIAFDLFTLFDPRTVVRIAESVVPGNAKAFCDAWRLRQFEYSWIHTAAGQYRDFRAVTAEALDYAARASSVQLSADARSTLMEAYERLDPWPDTRATLETWRRAGLKLAPLANYTAEMIEHLLRNGGVRDLFDEILSVERVRTFKPDPRAYAMGPAVLGLPRESIVFSAFGGWDAAGARWFGYPTFWVNRLGVPGEALAPGPDATGPTLKELAAWIASA